MSGSKLLIGGAIAAALVIPATQARALEPETRSVRVVYADLDLNGDAGAQVLLNRIERAARRACGANQGRRPISEQAAVRACQAEAVNEAVRSVNAPRLSALHFGDAPVNVASLEHAE